MIRSDIIPACFQCYCSPLSLYIWVGIVTGLWAGRPEIDSWQGQVFFLLVTTSGPALVPTQSPI